MFKTIGLFLLATLALGTASAADLVVTVTDQGISVPASVESGYTNVILDNQASIVYANEIVRLKEGADADVFSDGLIAFFSGTADDATIGAAMASYDLFLGGAVGTPAGSTRSVGLSLTPGTYVIYADGLSDSGLTLDKAHTAVLTVTASAAPAPEPTAEYTISLVEYAFALPADITAGTHLVRFENIGKEDHLGFVFKLPEGMTVEDAMAQMDNDGPTDWATAQGAHALGTGAVQYVEMTFEPGAIYLFDCPIPNDQGVPHDHLGMLQFLTIPGAD